MLPHFPRPSPVYVVLSESESYITTDGQPASLSCNKAPIWGLRPVLYYLCDSSCGAPSLTRGRVCLLYVLLALASAVFLGSESLGTLDHILLSQIQDFPFRRLLRLAGSRGRYSTPPPHGGPESYVTTDGQPASLSWSKAPIWGLRPDLYYMCDSYGLVLVGRPLWRTSDLLFIYASGPRQRSLSRVRVPWVLRPYFTVSDLRLPFSSPPTTRRVTVEVFDPASTGVCCVVD
jgi:hypothetical protein